MASGLREGPVEGGGDGWCSVVVLFRETDPEEPFPAGERTSRIGPIRRPGEAIAEAGSERSCSVVVLNRCGGGEEPSLVVEEGSRGS